MSPALELIRKVEEAGGRFRVEDNYLVVAPKDAIAHLLGDLRKHVEEVIHLLQSSVSRPVPPIDIEEWREPFAEWLDSRCAVHPRCSARLNSLFTSYSEWEIHHLEVPVVPTPEIFVQLLAEHGFSMVEACGTVLVRGLALWPRHRCHPWEARQTHRQREPEVRDAA
jgi:hypothetical protein